ncbi:hypothetical protein Psuf_072790 [Phytohabitans suffuscus]|uniref:Lipoprotein LpqB beta-propeller domain-containing protein n=1 Tax=Phytohabitans suffuscus TaxID=624315 RepID=A0A6F8YV79_9ACTN|nr:hypothetical protein Psuf_072790 [Phytohabitans suffuscus]
MVAGRVSAPSADLRYAIVTTLFTDRDTRRIGRYDTRTGEVRWYTAPAPAVSTPQISPDGRHAAYWMDGAKELEGVAVVDLETGRVNKIKVERRPVAAGGAGVSYVSFYPPRGHAWWLDDDRLTLHDTVYDLAGERVGRLPLPADADLVALRPDGAGGLVRPLTPAGAGALPPGGTDATVTFAITDAAGAVTSRFTLDRPSCPSAAPDCPSPVPNFLAWRGANGMLVWPGPGSYDGPETAIDTVDVRTGERRTIHLISGPPVDDLVTIPADRLAGDVRQRIAF